MGLIGHLAMGIGRGTGGRPLTAPAGVNDQKATSQDGLPITLSREGECLTDLGSFPGIQTRNIKTRTL